MRFIEKYRQVLTNIRFASKFTSLLLIVFIASDLCESLSGYFFEAEKAWINEHWNKIVIYVFFSMLLTIIFTARFILLWFKKPKFVWLSQLAWLVGWLTIFSYSLITTKILHGGFFEGSKNHCIDCYDAFLWASVTLVKILAVYLFFSPIKQIMVLLYSLFPEFKKKRI